MVEDFITRVKNTAQGDVQELGDSDADEARTFTCTTRARLLSANIARA